MGQSIQRAVNLIRRSAEHPLTLTEALEEARFVRKTGAGTYVFGSGLIELSELALGSMDLRQFAAMHLRELQRQTGHTVHLAQLTGDEIIYIEKVDSPAFDAVKLPSRVGRAVSLYASAVGKVILAYLPQAERDRLLAHVDYQKFTETTFADRESLDAELERIVERGWATDNGEHDAYVMCVAAPIRDSRGGSSRRSPSRPSRSSRPWTSSWSRCRSCSRPRCSSPRSSDTPTRSRDADGWRGTAKRPGWDWRTAPVLTRDGQIRGPGVAG
jgi:DNA-binding IclR family transcriptional regulator